MAVSPATFRTDHPVFTSLGDDLLEAVIERAGAGLRDDVPDRDTAVSLLAAHILVQEDALDGGAEAVRSRLMQTEKIGDVSRSWHMTGGTTGSKTEYSSLNETAYGRQFVLFMRARMAGPMVA